MSDIKRDTISGVKWTAIERISMQLFQFIIGIILARILEPKDFGVVGVLMIFIILTNTLIDGGFSNALIRKRNCCEKDYSTAFVFNILLGLLLYLFLYLAAPFIASFFNIPNLDMLLRVLAIVVVINSFCVVQIAKLSREIKFKIQAKATLISVVLSGILGIILAYNGFGVWSIVYQQLINALIKTIIIWTNAKWKPLFIFSKKSFDYLFGYGSKILLSNILGTLYTQMSTIIIGKFYTPLDLGYYTRGQQFAHIPTTALSDILGKVTFPILSKYQDDDYKLVSVYRKYISTTSLLIFFLMILLASIGNPLISVILSEKWMCSVIYLQLFCFSYMFEHISKLNLNLLQIKGRSDLYLRLEIIKKIIAFGIIISAIPFGVTAICVSVLVYSQISLLINTYYTGKLFNLGYKRQVKDFSKYLLFSILACMPAYLITFTCIVRPLQLIIGILISLLLYCLLLRNDIFFKEIVKILISKFK